MMRNRASKVQKNDGSGKSYFWKIALGGKGIWKKWKSFEWKVGEMRIGLLGIWELEIRKHINIMSIRIRLSFAKMRNRKT